MYHLCETFAGFIVFRVRGTDYRRFQNHYKHVCCSEVKPIVSLPVSVHRFCLLLSKVWTYSRYVSWRWMYFLAWDQGFSNWVHHVWISSLRRNGKDPRFYNKACYILSNHISSTALDCAPICLTCYLSISYQAPTSQWQTGRAAVGRGIRSTKRSRVLVDLGGSPESQVVGMLCL